MAVIVRIRCLECFVKFIVPSLTEVPERCPNCKKVINQKEMPEVAAPFIPLRGGERTKIIDQTYRDAEAAAEARIERAVAMTPGSSKEDFAGLKITDYRAGMVEGESAVKPPEPSQEFKRNAEALGKAGIPVQNGGIAMSGHEAIQFSNSTRSGPEPNAGVRAMDRLRTVHRGNLDPRMRNPISSIPALETQRPGYVPRGKAIIPGVGQ